MQDNSAIELHYEGVVAVIGFHLQDAVFRRQEVEAFEQQFREAMQTTPNPKFVLDFTGVQYMASDVLGTLVSALLEVRKRDGDLRLTGLSTEIRELFRVTGLHTVFQTSPRLDAAVKSLEPDAKPKPKRKKKSGA